MSLTHKYTQVFLFPSPNPKKLPSTPKPFDETLIRRLTALLASLCASPSVHLSSLTLAIDLLAATLTSFSLLLADPTLPRSEPDAAALSSHLDSASAALLDSANSLSSLLDRLSRLRLHLAFAIHLLSHRPLTPDLTRKARDSVAEWPADLRSSEKISLCDLSLVGEAPRGRASAVQRAIYAVEAVSALVIGLVSSSLGARTDLSKIRVSSEFSWSAAVNGVLTAIKGKKASSFAAEIEAVDSSVKKLTAVLDHDDEITVELRSMTEEAEKKTEELTEGLNRLGNAVDGLFRAELCARNAALQGFKIGPKKCKLEGKGIYGI